MSKKNKEKNNTIQKDRKEWLHEWGLEKQTEGLTKNAVKEQEGIVKDLEKNPKTTKK